MGDLDASPLPTLGRGEIVHLLWALVAVVMVEGGLRVMALPRLARLMGTPLSLDETISGESLRNARTTLVVSDRARRRIAATRRILRHWPFGDSCLRRALACGHVLRDLGPTLHLGVAKIDDQVRAHAWVIVEGKIIDPDRAASSYLRLEAPGQSKSGS